MKEKKARVEDALHATRAAVEEGIVAGGGVALIRAQASLDKLKVPEEQKFGVQIIRRAIEEPLRQIVQNAGLEGLDRRQQGPRGQGRLRLQRGDRPVRQAPRAGRHRPGEGRSHGAPERGERREPHAHDRVPRRRAPEGREGGGGGGGHAGHGHGDF